MNDEQNISSALTCTDDSNALNRKQQIEALLLRTYPQIDELIEAEADRHLTVFDFNRLKIDIAGDVHREYSGPSDDDEAFLTWAAPAVKKRVQFYLIRRECEKAVYAGIWTVMHGAEDLSQYDNPVETVKEIAEDTWGRIWTKWEELVASDVEASWPTRLREKAYWQARAWKTSQLRERKRFEDVLDRLAVDEEGQMYLAPEETECTQLEMESA